MPPVGAATTGTVVGLATGLVKVQGPGSDQYGRSNTDRSMENLQSVMVRVSDAVAV